jgi:succinate dehydrogenase / fumarate reductase cytochrome b subunit
MDDRTRPLSPFLIYRPQITSVLSFAHRASGVFLTIGTLLLVCWLIAVASGPETYADAQRLLGSAAGQAALALWSFALYYHLCNGIRHLAWDAGFGFALDTVNKSGWAVVIASVVLTVASWWAALGAAA